MWGRLLRPQQTLTGQLNAGPFQSMWKDRACLQFRLSDHFADERFDDPYQAKQYEPDMVIWLTTLDAFPKDKQLTSPIVANNAERIRELYCQVQVACRSERSSTGQRLEMGANLPESETGCRCANGSPGRSLSAGAIRYCRCTALSRHSEATSAVGCSRSTAARWITERPSAV